MVMGVAVVGQGSGKWLWAGGDKWLRVGAGRDKWLRVVGKWLGGAMGDGAGDGFVRVTVRTGSGKSTSVSLDTVLFEALVSRVGTWPEATAWVRDAVLRAEKLEEAGDPLVCVRGAGLSRQVQRLALVELVGVVKKAPIQREPDRRLVLGELSAGLSSGGVDNLDAEVGQGQGEGIGVE